MRRLWISLALVVAASMSAASPLSDQFTPTGRLRVAIGVGPVGSAYWATKDPATGAPRGVAVDLAAALAQKLGVPLELVAYPNSGQITAAASTGAWDVTFVPYDAERAKSLDFGPVYDLAEASYLVPPGSPLQTLADVDKPGVRVAGIAGTTTGRAAQASLKHTTVTGYQTIEEIMELLRTGKADAFALPRGSLTVLAQSLPGARVLPGSFFTTQTAVAVPKGHALALAYASEFMENAKSNGLLAQILAANGFGSAKQ